MKNTTISSATLAMTIALLLLFSSGTGLAQIKDPLEKEMRAALAARVEAIPRAAADTTRPMYHFRPPARWMNDICGTIYHCGYHHIFYQSNPYLDDEYGWGWGHARSKDLVRWEELPFALPPMKHRGERRCNSGCVTLDGDGHLLQTPAPERKELRGEHTQVTDVAIDSGFNLIEGAQGNTLEIVTEFVPGNATAFGLKLRSSDDGKRAITLRYADGALNLAGTEVPLKLEGENKTLKLHVFLDRSVMEVFINSGRVAVTRVEYPGEADLGIAVFAENGNATLKSLDVWQMKPIW